MRPSIAPTASIARLPATARSSDSPGTTTSESPAIQTRSFFLGENFARFGGAAAVVRRARSSCGSGTATAVSISSSSERPSTALSARARPVEEERAAHGLERPGDRERDVALPALGLDRRGLVQARGVQEQRDDERRRARRRSPSRPSAGAVLPRRSAPRGRVVSVSRSSPSELEVDERCHALGPHRVDDEERRARGRPPAPGSGAARSGP